MVLLLTRYITLGFLVLILGFNLTQRNHLEHGEGKRYSTLYAAGPFFVIYVGSFLMERYEFASWFYIIIFTVAVLFTYRLRHKIFVFKTRCVSCGTRLPLERTLYYDSNLCKTCTAGAPEVKVAAGHIINAQGLPEHEEGAEAPGVPDTVEEIDWKSWQAKEEAVICYVRDNDRLLLMHKKTGLGRGKINAPGGRIEEGETPEQAAVREMQEEVHITPLNPEKRVELFFQFTTGYSLHGYVFFAESYEGRPEETDEADPFWVSLEDIPYDDMWEDDRVWLPEALAGTHLKGYFIFDGNSMISHRLEKEQEEALP